MPLATLAGGMSIPISLIDLEQVTETLTLGYKPMGEEEQHLEAFYIDGRNIVVPRQFGLGLCRRLDIDYHDYTSTGTRVVFPRSPTPRPYQVEGLKLIAEAQQDYYDFLFRARTGWGKTAGALYVASQLGVSTLVIVDQENLKEQWISAIQQHCGLRRDQVGVIQGKTCDFKGKAVTIAMVQTLSQKDFPQEVYDYFGFLIVDEVHIIGAPTFSTVLLKFSATHRLGVSATIRRRDGLQKVLDYNLGRVRVYIADEHEPSAVYVVEHDTVYSEYANRAPKIGRFINEVTEDGARNLLVAESAAYLYDTGRDILVLSDRIEQLQHLHSLYYYLGIPEGDIGVYAGSDYVYSYEKDPSPLRRPPDLIRYDGTEGFHDRVEKTPENPTGIVVWGPGYYYTPISLQLIAKRAKKGKLEHIKDNARIINATYGKFSKGVDVPRLSGGVDASPRSRSEQEQGRILRKLDGKLKPIWITPVDVNSYRSVFSLARRIDDYIINNAVISRWTLEEGKAVCNAKEIQSEMYEEVKRLKSLRIATSSGGLYTLQTKQEAKRSEIARVTSTTTTRAPARRSSSMASSRSVKSVR